jgi:large subunit ribosomal protein L30
VPDKTHKTIRIQWVRSGIGFTHHQKTIVRSLGLKRLNQTVVRPDTPQIRGIVAAVPHLLAIVPDTPAPAWASVPEYTVHPPEVTLTAPVEAAVEAVGAKAASEAATADVEAAAAGQAELQPAEPVKPAKATRKKAEKAPAKATAKKVKAPPAEEAKPKATKKKEAPKKESKPTKGSKK